MTLSSDAVSGSTRGPRRAGCPGRPARRAGCDARAHRGRLAGRRGVRWCSACLLGAGLRRAGMPALGPANRVTLARAIAGRRRDRPGRRLLRPAGRTRPALVALIGVALALDGVDGQVARRTGTTSRAGRALRHGGRRVPDPGAERVRRRRRSAGGRSRSAPSGTLFVAASWAAPWLERAAAAAVLAQGGGRGPGRRAGRGDRRTCCRTRRPGRGGGRAGVADLVVRPRHRLAVRAPSRPAARSCTPPRPSGPADRARPRAATLDHQPRRREPVTVVGYRVGLARPAVHGPARVVRPPADRARRRRRHRVRVQDRGDRLDAVDQPRAGTHHQAVPVDRPHRRAGKCGDDRRGLRRSAVQVESARCDQDDVRLGRGELRPRWSPPTGRPGAPRPAHRRPPAPDRAPSARR